MGVMGKGYSFVDTQFWSKERYVSILLQKLETLFFYTIDLILMFDFISIGHGIFWLYFLLKFSPNKRSKFFLVFFIFELLCEFF
jgi:hypothetical protein